MRAIVVVTLFLLLVWCVHVHCQTITTYKKKPIVQTEFPFAIDKKANVYFSQSYNPNLQIFVNETSTIQNYITPKSSACSVDNNIPINDICFSRNYDLALNGNDDNILVGFYYQKQFVQNNDCLSTMLVNTSNDTVSKILIVCAGSTIQPTGSFPYSFFPYYTQLIKYFDGETYFVKQGPSNHNTMLLKITRDGQLETIFQEPKSGYFAATLGLGGPVKSLSFGTIQDFDFTINGEIVITDGKGIYLLQKNGLTTILAYSYHNFPMTSILSNAMISQNAYYYISVNKCGQVLFSDQGNGQIGRIYTNGIKEWIAGKFVGTNPVFSMEYEDAREYQLQYVSNLYHHQESGVIYYKDANGIHKLTPNTTNVQCESCAEGYKLSNDGMACLIDENYEYSEIDPYYYLTLMDNIPQFYLFVLSNVHENSVYGIKQIGNSIIEIYLFNYLTQQNALLFSVNIASGVSSVAGASDGNLLFWFPTNNILSKLHLDTKQFETISIASTINKPNLQNREISNINDSPIVLETSVMQHPIEKDAIVYIQAYSTFSIRKLYSNGTVICLLNLPKNFYFTITREGDYILLGGDTIHNLSKCDTYCEFPGTIIAGGVDISQKSLNRPPNMSYVSSYIGAQLLNGDLILHDTKGSANGNNELLQINRKKNQLTKIAGTEQCAIGNQLAYCSIDPNGGVATGYSIVGWVILVDKRGNIIALAGSVKNFYSLSVLTPQCLLNYVYDPIIGVCTKTCPPGTETFKIMPNVTTGICLKHECYGISSNDSLVCSGNGNCSSFDMCECYSGWKGSKNCSSFSCDGVSNCDGVGVCISNNTCQCPFGRTGPACENILTCNGISYSSYGNVCNGRGNCTNLNNCTCRDGYYGNNCELFNCWNIPSNNTNVCNQNGNCSDFDTCKCNEGYYGNECHLFTCQNITFNNSFVCSGNGKCSSFNNCTCNPGYVGKDCQNFTCFGIRSDSQLACSGNGTCISLNNCSCYSNYSGYDCSVLNVTIYQNETFNNTIYNNTTFNNTIYNNTIYNNTIYNNTINNNTIYNNTVMNNTIYNNTVVNNTITNDTIISNGTNYGNISVNIDNSTIRIVDVSFGFQNALLWVNPLKLSYLIDAITFSRNVTFKNINLFKYRIEIVILKGQSLISRRNFIGVGIGTPKINSIVNESITTDKIIFPNRIPIDLTLDTMFSDGFSISFNFENFTSEPFNVSLIEPSVLTQSVAITPKIGKSIESLFDISISGDNLSRFQYAVGFYHSSRLESIRLTQFSQNSSIQSAYPFLKSSLKGSVSELQVSIFIKDSQSNIFSYKFSNETISLEQNTLSINSMNSLQIALLVYDESDSNTISYSEILEKLPLTADNYREILPIFETLTQNVTKLTETALSTLHDKLQQLLRDKILKNERMNIVEKFDSSQSVINVLSNTLDFEKTQNSIDLLSDLVNQEIYLKLIENNETPVKLLQSTNINMTLSQFLLSNDSNVSVIDLGNTIMFDLKQIHSNDYSNGYSKVGMRLVTQRFTSTFSSKNLTDNLQPLSNIVDYKHYENGELIILKDLKTPILIKFDQNIKISNQNISCKYWNEDFNEWRIDGCSLHSLNLTTITCQCSHTTKFSTFLETQRMILNNENVPFYNIQIAFGSFFTLCCIFLFIVLLIFRKKQPISSRLITPFLGLIALFVESVLILVTHRSLLISFILDPLRSTKQDSFSMEANWLIHIATIFVNTLNLSAIFSYLLQVLRVQFMKSLYNKLYTQKTQRGRSRVMKLLRFITSPYTFYISVTIFGIINILYWTLWVVLRRVSVLETREYSTIVSSSYLGIIFLFSIIISVVAIGDIISSLFQERKTSKKRQSIISTNSPNSLRKSNITAPIRFVIQMDRPLYFRTEMMLYLMCFSMMIVQLSMGLSSLFSKNQTELENGVLNSNFEYVQFAFEVLYTIFYLLIFGGYAIGILVYYQIKNLKGKLVNNDQEKQDETELRQLLKDERGYNLFEMFCIKEFSVENIYLWTFLNDSKAVMYGNDIASIQETMSLIIETFLSTNSTFEVNIPSSCKKEFLKVHSSLGASNDLEHIVKVYKEVQQVHESLSDQIEINLEDTFSRFIYTEEYNMFRQNFEMKIELTQHINVVSLDNQT